MGDGPETRVEELLEEHDRFDKGLVLGIVITTLLAALVALGQMRALQRHDQAIARADQWSSLAAQTSFSWNSVAQLQIDRYRLAQDARAQSQQARADAFYDVGYSRGAARAQARDWAQVTNVLSAESTGMSSGAQGFGAPDGSLSQIGQLTAASVPDLSSAASLTAARCPGVDAGPVQRAPGAVPQVGPDSAAADPYFPARYLADTRRPAYALQADGLLASEHAEAEEKQFTRLGVSLTLFATAVFLLGFGLSPYGRAHRHLYATGAAVLVVGSAGWSIYALASAAPGQSVQAAVAYADGRAASDKGDAADTQLAIDLFKCAIRHDPGFAPAYSALGLAEDSVTAPGDPTGAGNTELIPVADRRQAESALARAQQLGAQDPTLPEVQGTNVFEIGLRHDDRTVLERALELEQDSAQLLTGSGQLSTVARAALHPNLHASAKERTAALESVTDDVAYNIAQVQLALGNIGAAHAAYQTATALARDEIADSNAMPEVYVSGALTDLTEVYDRFDRGPLRNTVQARRIRREALRDKAMVVAELEGQDGDRHSGRGMYVLNQLTVTPGLTLFVIPRLGDAKPTDVNAQWYYRRSTSAAWADFATQLSGPQQLQQIDGYYVAIDSFAPTSLPDPECLPSGQYMLEVYVDGHLAKTVVDPNVTLPATRPARVPGMDLSVCLPANHEQGWHATRAGSTPTADVSVPGLDAEYVSANRGAGLDVFDVSPEADAASSGGRGPTAQVLKLAIGQFAGSLPRPLIKINLSSTIHFLGGSKAYPEYFYAYPGGGLVATVGVTDPGRVLVVAAYGPLSMFKDPGGGLPKAVELLGSVTTTEGAQ